MSSLPTSYKAGTQKPVAYLKAVKNKNIRLGIVLGLLILALMSLPLLMKG